MRRDNNEEISHIKSKLQEGLHMMEYMTHTFFKNHFPLYFWIDTPNSYVYFYIVIEHLVQFIIIINHKLKFMCTYLIGELVLLRGKGLLTCLIN